MKNKNTFSVCFNFILILFASVFFDKGLKNIVIDLINLYLLHLIIIKAKNQLKRKFTYILKQRIFCFKF